METVCVSCERKVELNLLRASYRVFSKTYIVISSVGWKGLLSDALWGLAHGSSAVLTWEPGHIGD